MILILFAALKSRAYPEMIRHGYTHCTACHVSPTGGGLMTAYGRSLSKELISRWSFEGEERLFHGVGGESVSRWLNSDEDSGLFVGGNFRFLQYHRENELERARRAFPMQADLEAAYRGEWGSVGAVYGVEKRGEEKKNTLRRWAVVLRPAETVWTRAGLGTPHWGLMTSEHIWTIRQDLGFGPLDRRHLLEVEHQGEKWGALLGYAESDDSLAEPSREKAGYGRADLVIGLNKKVGVDYWQGRFPDVSRALTGAHALWGWNEHWVTLAQFTVQTRSTRSDDSQSWYLFQKTSFEFTRGLWANLYLDASERVQGDPDTRLEKYGPGFQFFPRPHFEIQAAWLTVRDRRLSDRPGDEAYLILHYYL